MGFLTIFSGKSPEDHERKGDSLYKAKAFGDAKLEYEAGLHKLEKKEPENLDLKNRFHEKILQTKEDLALYHKLRGDEILESQYYEGAEEAFQVALELTKNPKLKETIRRRLLEIQNYAAPDMATDTQDLQFENPDPAQSDQQTGTDEYFAALCGSFSDKKREKDYYSYGIAFKEGFLALSQGDFKLASERLLQAMEENETSSTYIPLELATAYLNLGKNQEAQSLLSSFLINYPNSLQAYQLMCEIFWEINNFDQATDLLENCPQEIANTLEILLLQGETFFRSEDYEAAKELLLGYMKNFGWDERIGLLLARVYEELNEKERARDLYGKIIDQNSCCGKQIVPFIKQRYADISLECGHCSTKILELYLSLIQEDPDNRGYHYQKIGEIYASLGNEKEARRYLSLAEKLI